jgi:hypothetical protein
VDVHLRSCITRGAVLRAAEDRYELTGPTPVVERLTEILGQSDVGNIGFLAPLAQVNLDPASRLEAGVPENAVYFRFVYPPRGMTGTISEAVVDEICRDGLNESWLHFIILGGFAYYGGDGLLIQLNALQKLGRVLFPLTAANASEPAKLAAAREGGICSEQSDRSSAISASRVDRLRTTGNSDRLRGRRLSGWAI